MWTSGLGVLNHSSKVTFKQRLLVYLTSPNFFSVFSLVMFYLLSLKDGLILWMCLLNECWGTLCSFLIWDKHYILFLLLDFWLSRLFCNIVISIQWLTSMTIYICKSPDQTKALWDIMKLEEERLKENKGMRQREFWRIPRKLLQTLQTLLFESNRSYVKGGYCHCPGGWGWQGAIYWPMMDVRLCFSSSGLSSFYSELMKGLGAGSRLWELLEREPELPFNGGSELGLLFFAGIKHVWFRTVRPASCPTWEGWARTRPCLYHDREGRGHRRGGPWGQIAAGCCWGAPGHPWRWGAWPHSVHPPFPSL